MFVILKDNILSGTITKMFGSVKKWYLSYQMMMRLNRFLYVFNLRQGTILIAIHQIALSAFILIILVVGISHVGEMLSMLHNDMVDDADRRGLYDAAFGEHLTYHNGNVITTNNQRRFAKAQQLASVTVILLYTSTILTSIYLMCCISLLHGAVKYKREYVMPWIMAACVGVLLLFIAIIVGDDYPFIVNHFGGLRLYYMACTLFVLTFIYAICAVCSFAIETSRCRCVRSVRATNDERGERLLLLDHVAHSSLLSAAQLNKLSSGTCTQFV